MSDSVRSSKERSSRTRSFGAKETTDLDSPAKLIQESKDNFDVDDKTVSTLAVTEQPLDDDDDIVPNTNAQGPRNGIKIGSMPSNDIVTVPDVMDKQPSKQETKNAVKNDKQDSVPLDNDDTVPDVHDEQPSKGKTKKTLEAGDGDAQVPDNENISDDDASEDLVSDDTYEQTKKSTVPLDEKSEQDDDDDGDQNKAQKTGVQEQLDPEQEPVKTPASGPTVEPEASDSHQVHLEIEPLDKKKVELISMEIARLAAAIYNKFKNVLKNDLGWITKRKFSEDLLSDKHLEYLVSDSFIRQTSRQTKLRMEECREEIDHFFRAFAIGLGGYWYQQYYLGGLDTEIQRVKGFWKKTNEPIHLAFGTPKHFKTIGPYPIIVLKKGHVYSLFVPKRAQLTRKGVWIKVGCTTRSVKVRAKEHQDRCGLPQSS